ncbi:MAG: hypothetical protein ACO1QR_13670 [Chthoniobacteraceae bacterium]
MKALDTSLAVAAGLLAAVFIAAFMESEGWSSSRIIPGLALGSIATIGLIRRHVPITRFILCVHALLLLVLVVHALLTRHHPLAVSLWSVTYFAVMLAINRLRKSESPLLPPSSGNETAE